MRRHCSAQRRHAWAHSRQWSIECISHSWAQASQTSAQVSQIIPASSLPRAMYPAASRQRAAQSMSSRMQRAIALTSFSFRQEAAQWSQATAQSLQASMQDWNC